VAAYYGATANVAPSRILDTIFAQQLIVFTSLKYLTFVPEVTKILNESVSCQKSTAVVYHLPFLKTGALKLVSTVGLSIVLAVVTIYGV
jgi:hypothetical protein